MSSTTVDKEFEGFRYTRHSIPGSLTSSYIKTPKLGTGLFEILSMSLHPSNAQHYVMPAALQYNWDDGVTNYYRFLKYGYIGAFQGLEIQNVKVVGPGTLLAWIEDPTTYGAGTRLEVTYRRLI